MINKEEFLNKYELDLGIDYTKLVPTSILKTKLYLMHINDFEELRKYMNISDYNMVENDWDTIIIGNRIYKRDL
jgi:hypothetical protein